MQTIGAATGPLTTVAMASMCAYFDAQGHCPSDDHWGALQQIAETLESMAEGTCADKVFLSAVDPGIGKTQTVVHFARALTTSEHHRQVGMLICVGRLNEVRSLAASLGIEPGKLAILTSDKELNALGAADPGTAQVLITTQQRIEVAAKGGLFSEVRGFDYLGTNRRVRVWDEAWLPGIALTLNRAGLLLLFGLVQQHSPTCADAIADFANDLRTVKDGDLVQVPDFAALYGVSLHEVLADTVSGHAGYRDDQRMAATALLALNGRTTRARIDGRIGAAVLTYVDTLPDFRPLLVLDASGRMRRTYQDVATHRGDLVRLKEAVKDYSPLTIHAWKAGGGKSSFGKEADKLIAGIVEDDTQRAR